MNFPKSKIFLTPRLEIISATLLVLFSLVCLWYGSRHSIPEREVLYENAITAAERMKDWSIWLTGIETGTMAAMGLLAKDRGLTATHRRWAFFTLVFLSLSLLLSVWIVASLPGMVLQLDGPSGKSPKNDLYYHTYDTATKVHLSTALGLQHVYFMMGSICFSVFIYLMFSNDGRRRDA